MFILTINGKSTIYTTRHAAMVAFLKARKRVGVVVYLFDEYGLCVASVRT